MTQQETTMENAEVTLIRDKYRKGYITKTTLIYGDSEKTRIVEKRCRTIFGSKDTNINDVHLEFLDAECVEFEIRANRDGTFDVNKKFEPYDGAFYTGEDFAEGIPEVKVSSKRGREVRALYNLSAEQALFMQKEWMGTKKSPKCWVQTAPRATSMDHLGELREAVQ